IDTSLFGGMQIALPGPNSSHGFGAAQLSDANLLDPSVYNVGAADPFVSYLAPMYPAIADPLVNRVNLSAARVPLRRAKAAQRGWIQGDVLEEYLPGVFSSLEQYGIADGTAQVYQPETHQMQRFDAGAFRNTLTEGFEAATDKVEMILGQKWAASFSTLEGWFEWRRTGYPTLAKTLVNGPQGAQIAARTMYGASEVNYNRATTEAATSRLEPAADD